MNKQPCSIAKFYLPFKEAVEMDCRLRKKRVLKEPASTLGSVINNFLFIRRIDDVVIKRSAGRTMHHSLGRAVAVIALASILVLLSSQSVYAWGETSPGYHWDNGGEWSDETNAYDYNETTSSSCSPSTEDGWTEAIIFTIDSSNSALSNPKGYKWRSTFGSNVDKIEIAEYNDYLLPWMWLTAEYEFQDNESIITNSRNGESVSTLPAPAPRPRSRSSTF